MTPQKEREAFEAMMVQSGLSVAPHSVLPDHYASSHTDAVWVGWQARAALADAEQEVKIGSVYEIGASGMRAKVLGMAEYAVVHIDGQPADSVLSIPVSALVAIPEQELDAEVSAIMDAGVHEPSKPKCECYGFGMSDLCCSKYKGDCNCCHPPVCSGCGHLEACHVAGDNGGERV